MYLKTVFLSGSLCLLCILCQSQNHLDIHATDGSHIEIKGSTIVNGVLTQDNKINDELLLREFRTIFVKLDELTKAVIYIRNELKQDEKTVNGKLDKQMRAVDSIARVIEGLSSKDHLTITDIKSSYHSFIVIANKELQSASPSKDTRLLSEKLKELEDRIQPLDYVKIDSVSVKNEKGIYVTAEKIRDLDVFIFPAREGRRRILYNNKAGFFFPAENKIAIKAKYDYATDFSEGLALVKKDDELFFIDSNDNVFLREEIKKEGVREMHSFSYGLAAAKGRYDMFYFKKDREKLYGDRLFDYCSDLKDGIGIIQYTIRKKHYAFEEYHFIDSTGKELFGRGYSRANPFGENNLAVVADLSDNYFLINRQGKRLGSAYFQKIGTFSEGLAPVYVRRYDGYRSVQYDSVLNNFQKRAPIGTSYNYYNAFIDTLGNIRFKTDLPFSACSDFQHGRVVLRLLDGKYTLIDSDNACILKPEFNDIQVFVDEDHYRATKGMWVYYFKIDANGFAAPIVTELSEK